MKNRGFSLMELLILITIVGMLGAIAIPMFQSVRLGAALASAEQEVSALLHRARWLAITSGRPATTVELGDCSGADCTAVLVKSGTTVLASRDLTEYHVKLAGTDFPFTFDNRGFVPGGRTPTLVMSSLKASGTRTLTVTPVGKIS
jgi:prepilin-type N-terminal cleavage/methylation domain-containing protein